MIVKELGEAPAVADRFAQAGRRAEEQMAFYLHRAFEDAGSLTVINGLRLADGRDAAQIDHLVIHRYGMVVVESKSVTTTVRINDHGEWSRRYNGAWHGMPSPILQAQRQAEFLRGYLDAQREILRDKVLFRQAGFQSMPIDVIVAISDTGIIERPTRLAVDEVCKAEQVTSRVQAIVETYRAADSPSNGLFKLKPKERSRAYTASTDELARITRFLLDCHTPLALMAAHAPANAAGSGALQQWSSRGFPAALPAVQERPCSRGVRLQLLLPLPGLSRQHADQGVVPRLRRQAGRTQERPAVLPGLPAVRHLGPFLHQSGG